MYEGPIQDLIDQLAKLPGLGPKGAQRIAFHLLAGENVEIDRLISALGHVRDDVTFCIECGNVAADKLCRICGDARRDVTKICVVEEPKDIYAIERTKEFDGRYHVLGGALDPLSGIGQTSSGSANCCAASATSRTARTSRRSSSPPTRTPRAKPPRPTCCACSRTFRDCR